MWLVEKVWREGRPSSEPGKEPQRSMAAKDEYPQCPPWETQKVEENTAFFNAVFNTKHKKTNCRDVLGEREDAMLGLDWRCQLGRHARSGAGC